MHKRTQSVILFWFLWTILFWIVYKSLSWIIIPFRKRNFTCNFLPSRDWLHCSYFLLLSQTLTSLNVRILWDKSMAFGYFYLIHSSLLVTMHFQPQRFKQSIKQRLTKQQKQWNQVISIRFANENMMKHLALQREWMINSVHWAQLKFDSKIS